MTVKDQLRRKDAEFIKFQEEVRKVRIAQRAQRLRNEAVLRIVAIVICDSFVVSLATQLMVGLGFSPSAGTPISGTYAILAGIVSLIAPATWVLVGRERLQQLWWPVRKILGVEK